MKSVSKVSAWRHRRYRVEKIAHTAIKFKNEGLQVLAHCTNCLRKPPSPSLADADCKIKAPESDVVVSKLSRAGRWLSWPPIEIPFGPMTQFEINLTIAHAGRCGHLVTPEGGLLSP